VGETYPSEKSWSEFVSWDVLNFPIYAKNKTNVPNQPGLVAVYITFRIVMGAPPAPPGGIIFFPWQLLPL
jgi:hypothetical protein